MARVASTSLHPPRTAARGPQRASRTSGLGSTLIGLFVGIAVGIGLAAGVAFYLMRAGNPYQPAASASAREAPRDPARPGRSDSPAEKPRFDFYKILPGAEEPKGPQRPAAERSAGDRATAERALSPTPKIEETRPPAAEKAAPDKAVPEKVAAADPAAGKSSDRFWLQAGSFSTEGDAENLKAQLALSGWEASLQQATLPDKSVRYRVRLGPYTNVDEMNRIRADLSKRGFEVSAIKN
jgi:cell division protein FtsN